MNTDNWGEDSIICPYCGYEDINIGDFLIDEPYIEEGVEEEWCCPKCDKEFTAIFTWFTINTDSRKDINYD